MTYAIEYEHLKDELIVDSKTRWDFNAVKEAANRYKMELSDDDFARFFKMQARDIDIDWIMHQMVAYEKSLTDALISYIVY